jgi:hypothetical protein
MMKMERYKFNPFALSLSKCERIKRWAWTSHSWFDRLTTNGLGWQRWEAGA